MPDIDLPRRKIVAFMEENQIRQTDIVFLTNYSKKDVSYYLKESKNSSSARTFYKTARIVLDMPADYTISEDK